MKLTRYLYKGPQSGAQLRVGAKAELLEVQLHPGKPVDLPADHEYTQVLITLKHLEPITEEAAAPAPAKKETRQ